LGFIEYAWSISLQKDDTKVKIVENSTLDQPILKNDLQGFTIELPIPRLIEPGMFQFLGFMFPANSAGKVQIGRLLRAVVLHLSAHTILPVSPETAVPQQSDSILEKFAKSLINDVFVNAYIKAKFPESLIDLAYANAFAFQKIKSPSRIIMSSTRAMTLILTRFNVGPLGNSTSYEEDRLVDDTLNCLFDLKQNFAKIIHSDCNPNNIQSLFDYNFKNIRLLLQPLEPFLEAPSLRHTESLGACSIYKDSSTFPIDDIFKSSFVHLNGKTPILEDLNEVWKPEQDAAILQAFNSDQYQKQREKKVLSKIEAYLPLTNFRALSFPQEDYTQYLRARNIMQGASRRLLDILRSAFNYLDEDPRQEMGQLDLAAVIQSLASNKPATDVFVLDEYLKPSFAWSIIYDVSNSMQVKGEYGRALAIAVAEAAKELMTDPTSWTFFAFNDQLYVLKDSTESYSKRVRARIGGLKFEGLTYLPDAIQIAGKMLAKRFEEQRCLIVISDGWPFGYDNMPQILKKSVEDLLNRGVIVLGIGVETDQMGKYFRLHSAVYTQKDLVNKFGLLYMNSSSKSLET
jgi:hypothetical protein